MDGDDMKEEVIELLSESDDDEEAKPPPFRMSAIQPAKPRRRRKSKKRKSPTNNDSKPQALLQGGLVLEEDIIDSSLTHCRRTTQHDDADEVVSLESYVQQQEERKLSGLAPILYHDVDFESSPASIEGSSRSKRVEKCRCSHPVTLSTNRQGRPYFHCAKRRCNYFRYSAQGMHWYRFGPHTGHSLVVSSLFSANDLVQGKVGDCWFLSALAVIAERPDLIGRLFSTTTTTTGGGRNNTTIGTMNPYGIVQVNLFVDGWWKTVTMDSFLPCMINDKSENEFQQAIEASRMASSGRTTTLSGAKEESVLGARSANSENTITSTSSKFDPFALSDKNRQVLADTQSFLNESSQKKPVNPYAKKPTWQDHKSSSNNNNNNNKTASIIQQLQRVVTTDDLAYSKAKKQQLWVPFLEKAYAKIHGSFGAISGGHIAEAFLDLTGAPTMVYNLHAIASPKSFWYKLLSYRHLRLPMGCGTATSQVGIIGMHAYSILDVAEVRNVGVGFFQEKLADRSLGNVSGFTEFDGTVRLLRIRNPHGKGEWQGEFSDKSDVWEKLLLHKRHDSSASSPNSPGLAALERTMKNDGTFWIDYDSFLMGFSNVDVVLAFHGNHAKSFRTNFPEKKSNHRCTRAFEVCLLDAQPGVPSRDTVELFVMGIQKTRRGASQGRTDRKVSYKICDMGILVGEAVEDNSSGKAKQDAADEDDIEFASVEGEMFGFNRNGHYRLVVDRKKHKRLIIMPVSFGHPAATDQDRSWVLRCVADAPLLIRELPTTPRMDKVLQSFCFSDTLSASTRQRKRTVLLEDTTGKQLYGEPLWRVFRVDCLANSGGVVFIYLCINELHPSRVATDDEAKEISLNLSIEATCRGMMCRTENGFEAHETLAKGKKFEASWRKFNVDFQFENKTRLLMVLVQSGQDSEMGSTTCNEINGVPITKKGGLKQSVITPVQGRSSTISKPSSGAGRVDDFESLGVFNGCTNPIKAQSLMFGPNATRQDLGIVNFGMIDIELEQALALSRGDTELQEALALSRRESEGVSAGVDYGNTTLAMNDDQALQLALERSRTEGALALSKIVSDRSSMSDKVAMDDDQALRLALERSRTESLAHRKAIRPTQSKCDKSENILVDTAALDLKEAIKRSLEESRASPHGHGIPQKKPLKPIDIIEIDDTEEDVGLRDVKMSGKEEKDNSDPSDRVADVQKRRRLAAAAAERRCVSGCTTGRNDA